MKTAFALVALLALSACTTSTSAPTDDTSDALSSDLTAAHDPVLIANAKAFYADLLNHGDHRAESSIAYAKLPGHLGPDLEANNPDPTAEWAAEAFKARVKNSKGNLATVYAVIDGIDDEGEDITVYTSNGTTIAEGDDYRGFRWTL